ncbi:hypothetical protein SH449x_000210 [Pirellulaceae bacterium SH449]
MDPGLSNSSMELRRHLLRFNGDDIVRRMKESGLETPVGLIVEMTDRMGKVLTYAAMESNGIPKHEIPELIARYTKDQATPTFLYVVDLQVAKRILSATSESAEVNLSAPLPSGRGFVVIVAGGGNSYAQVPLQ